MRKSKQLIFLLTLFSVTSFSGCGMVALELLDVGLEVAGEAITAPLKVRVRLSDLAIEKAPQDSLGFRAIIITGNVEYLPAALDKIRFADISGLAIIFTLADDQGYKVGTVIGRPTIMEEGISPESIPVKTPVPFEVKQSVSKAVWESAAVVKSWK